MKNFIILISIFLFTITSSNSQTLVKYDNMETWNWPGLWLNASNVDFPTNASVSSNRSARLRGNGTTTRANTYRLPNVTGLDATKQYQLSFRLASYCFSNTSSAARGVDVADYVSVLISVNGGSYIEELRITGNNNALWAYNSSAIFHTANGSFSGSTTYNQLPLTSPATSDIYRSPLGTGSNQTFISNGPSSMFLNLPAGITQVAVDIYCRVNADGEEWWFDNIELWDITPIPLPVELMSFEGFTSDDGNLIKWKTASEYNSDYFLVEKSINGEFSDNSSVSRIEAAGNSNQILDYVILDKDVTSDINYYRLLQFDFDGKYKIYGPIAIDNRESSKKIIKVINQIGQEINLENYSGIYFELYEDGTLKKSMK